MPYITSIERMGIEKGLQLGILKKAREDILKVLQARFQNISLPKTLAEMIKSVNDSGVLDMLLLHSATVESVPAFSRLVPYVTSKKGQLSASSVPN